MGMNDSESYLDELLRAVMEPKSNNATLSSNTENIENNVQFDSLNQINSIESGMSLKDEILSEGKMPTEDEKSSESEMPIEDDILTENETPMEDDILTENETPIEDDILLDKEMPLGNDILEENVTPLEDEIASDKEMPLGDDILEENVTPLEDEIASDKEIPLGDDILEENVTPLEDNISLEDITVEQDVTDDSLVEPEVQNQGEDEYMYLPDFEMDDETAREVEAMLNSNFDISEISDIVDDIVADGETLPGDDSLSETPPEIWSETSPEVMPEISSEIQAEITPEVMPEIWSETPPEISPEVMPEIQAEISPEAIPEILPEIPTEIASEITEGISLEDFDSSSDHIENLQANDGQKNGDNADVILDDGQDLADLLSGFSDLELPLEDGLDLSTFPNPDTKPVDDFGDGLGEDLMDEEIEKFLGMDSTPTDDTELEDAADTNLALDLDHMENRHDDFDLAGSDDVELIQPSKTEENNVPDFNVTELEGIPEDFSQDDIEALLAASAEIDDIPDFEHLSKEGNTEDDDLLSLLTSDDAAVSDDDLLGLLGYESDDNIDFRSSDDDFFQDNPEDMDDDNKKKKKEKKSRKRKKHVDSEEKLSEETTGEKKKGIFTKVIEFLTDDGEETLEDAPHAMDISEVDMSDILAYASEENKAILEELNSEEETKKKGKNKKKDKKEKKDKKNKKDENDELDEESEDEGVKKKKEKKPKKPKKEKKVKVDAPELEVNSRKLSPKKVIITFCLIATIMVAILALNFLFAKEQVLKYARTAYYAQDYSACYEALYGKDRNESDELIYQRSASMLRITRYVDSYEKYMAADMPLEALDALIQGVGNYEIVKLSAIMNDLEAELQLFSDKLDLYLQGFGLNRDRALKLYELESDEEYTNELLDISSQYAPVMPETDIDEPRVEYIYDALPAEKDIN